jgi:hypothetical protein
MVRVTSRGYIVRNLDETLRTVSANLDWEPGSPVESLDKEGTAAPAWNSRCRTAPRWTYRGDPLEW